MKDIDISILIGKTLIRVEKSEDNDNILFVDSDGFSYNMFHEQDCCEGVSIEDIEGDLQDLVGSPILQAEEVTSDEKFNGKPEDPESFTWTFYKLATVKGYITIRWLGESNGYYSESVSFCKLK